MNTRLLNIATLALVLLPIIAPMLPTTPIAAAQASVGAEIVDTSGNQTSPTTANVTIGDYVIFQIYDANASTENITVTIYVNGVENDNISVGFVGDVGTYQGKIEIRQAGQFIKVKYYYFVNDTGTYVDMGYLNGSLEPYTNVTIRYTSPYSNETVEINVTYIPPPARFYLDIYGRQHGNAYWVPRLGNCTQFNTSTYYNAYEWRIVSTQPAFTPGETYYVTLTASTLAGAGPVDSDMIEYTAVNDHTLVPASDTEANKIKSFIFQLDGIAEPWYIEGVDFNNPTTIGDKIIVTGTVYNSTGGLIGEISEAEVRLFVSIAKISSTSIMFRSPTITITIEDADANLDTMAAEHLAYPVEMQLLQNNIPAIVLEFDETGNNTGIFTAQVTIFDLYRNGLISEYDNIIDYNFTEIRVDDPQTRCLCYDLGQFKAQYFYADDAYTVEEQVILRNIVRCCPPLKITVMIEDFDLDLPVNVGDTVAVASIRSGGSLTGVTAYYYYRNTNTSVPAVRFNVYLVSSSGTKYDLTAKDDLNIYFEMVSKGALSLDVKPIIRATIDLSKVDWETVNRLVVGNNETLEKIIVEIYDIFNPDINATRHVITLEARLQDVALKADRDTLPVSFRIVDSSFTRENGSIALASCPGCYPWIKDTEGDAQIVWLKIIDPGANKDCCQNDTISSTRINMMLRLPLPNGSLYTFNETNTGRFVIPLYAIETNGTWNRYGTCYIELSPEFVETDANTSEFIGYMKIYSYITINGSTIRVAGCPSIWLDRARLDLIYVSEAINYARYTITFATFDANLSLSSNIVRYGDKVTIKVYDPDANLDTRANDTVLVEISFYCPLVRGTVSRYVWLYENGTNTSWFIGSIDIDSRLAGACNDLYCASVDVIYVDRTPNATVTINYGRQQLERNLSLNNNELRGLLIFAECDCNKVLKIEKMDYHPMKGEIHIYYSIPGVIGYTEVTNKIIPAYLDTRLLIEIKDADLNRRVDRVDTLDAGLVSIEVPGIVTPISLKVLDMAKVLNETDVNTGTFTISFTLRELFDKLREAGYITVPPTKTAEQVYYEILAGMIANNESIKIYYHDVHAACKAQVCGNIAPADVEASVKPFDINGEIHVVDSVTGEKHNDSVYNCGCVFGSCPSATGDVIDIIVKDISLLRYAGGPLKLAGNLTLQLAANGTVRPLVYGGFDSLRFIGYEYRNFTIDGMNITIPVPVFQIRGVVIYCQQPLVSTRPYIVAPVGSKVYFIYNDKINASGLEGEAKEVIGIGIPGLARDITETVQIPTDKIELRVFNGTAFVKSNVIKRGQPAALRIVLDYDPIAVRTVTGSDQFAVLMVIRDSNGKVLLFQFNYVSIGQTSVPFSLTAANTQSLPTGQYTIEIYAVTSMDALVRISPITTLQITIQ